MRLFAQPLFACGADIVHGFSTRRGGVSRGKKASLHLGMTVPPAAADVRENHRRFAAAVGYAPAHLVTARQVHGARVVRASAVTPDTEADGLWAARADGPVVLGVRSADCVPVLLVARDGRAVAAVHSGWRGTAAGAALEALRCLGGEGVAPHELVAALGPSISQAHFEVSLDVAARFPARFVRHDLGPRPRVDLRGVIAGQLMGAGVPATQIVRVGGCTYANPDQFFSFRRDKAGTGSQLSVVGYR